MQSWQFSTVYDDQRAIFKATQLTSKEMGGRKPSEFLLASGGSTLQGAPASARQTVSLPITLNF